jgi:multicomponent Na+:H+ antiporter subunit D
VLLAAALVIGLIPGAVPGIEIAASHFTDQASYIGWVLHGGAPHFGPAPTSHIEGYDYLYATGATLGALAVAALGLFGRPLRRRVPDAVLRPAVAALGGLRQLHSGHIGDYIAWWTAGAATLGGATMVFLR